MVDEHDRSYATGIALAATSAIAFGTLTIFEKLAYRHGAETIPLLARRFAVAALPILAVRTKQKVPITDG